MKRAVVLAVVTAVLAMRVVLATSESAAEPIYGEESLGTSPAATAQKQETTDAVSLFKARDYEGALKLWKEAVQKNVDLPPAQVIMAHLFLQANMPKEAQDALAQAAKDDPNDPETYLIMAGVATREKDFSKAESLAHKAQGLLATFTKSVKRKERLQPQIWSSLVGIAEARQDWAGAQKVLEEWLKVDAKNAGAMQRVGYCLLQQKNVDGALAKLREAAKADPAMLTPEAYLAQFCVGTGDFENAKKWMSAASTAAPKNLKTQLALGQSALDMGELDQAQKHAIAATKIAPRSVEARLLRGLTALYQKDFAAAESILEGVVVESPHNVAATNNLALALIEQGEARKSQRALELAEANVKQFPKWSQIASTYGLVLYRLGRLDDAENALRAAVSVADSDGDTAYALARLAIDRGHKSAAKQLLETVLKNRKSFMLRPDAEDLLEQLNKPEKP